MQSKARFRLMGFAATAVILLFVLACIDRPMKNATPAPDIGSAISIPQSAERDVDILFVIDNSGSMAGEQAKLRQQFPALMRELEKLTGGLPNVHLGVTSTDLGTGMFQIQRCNEIGGDAGRLMKPSGCANPTGTNYIVDVEPSNCEITKDASGSCTAHSCVAADCSHESSATFEVDAGTGCPRCRNYTGEALEDAFSCLAVLGTMGCGFEQQLESMYQALDPSNASNTGFIRENAFMAIIFITDEDDCSAANPQIFDDSQTDINSTLGPITSFRCFEFGVWCDINERTHQGMRQNCVPRDDPGALLHPVSRYTTFVNSLKDPQMLVVAAISGPVTPSPNGDGGNVTVGLDGYSQPEVQFSCTGTEDGAVPGIRLKAFIEHFNDEVDMSWAYTSICNSEYTSALKGIGDKIRDILEFQCLPSPLAGCADPGFEFGSPMDSCETNNTCHADCSVTDIFERGLPGEARSEVPPCLEVCSSGLCLGNLDNTAAYANGHPEERDASLPVSACWHINYQPECASSNFGEIIIARKSDPPPRSFSEVSCVQIAGTELLCNDMVDNDDDCLIDQEDPDCQ